MDPLQLTLYGLALMAAALSWAVARGRAPHRPVAWLLTFQIVTDLARLGLRELVFKPYYPRLGGGPATGWLRVAAHVEQALFVGWRLALLALVVRIFGRRHPWPVFLVYAAIVLGLIVTYPEVRGELLQRVYLAVELGVLCVSLGFIIRWYSGRQPWTPETVVTALLVTLGATMVLAGPYRVSIWTGWDKAWSALLVLYISLIAVEGWVWRSMKRS